MHFLYILYSKAIDRYYVGESENYETRLQLNNNHHFKKGLTKAASDWEIVYQYQCPSKEDALYLERFIKRMKSRKFILKIIGNPNILNDIIQNK